LTLLKIVVLSKQIAFDKEVEMKAGTTVIGIVIIAFFGGVPFLMAIATPANSDKFSDARRRKFFTIAIIFALIGAAVLAYTQPSPSEVLGMPSTSQTSRK
jgi:hypothetical protein